MTFQQDKEKWYYYGNPTFREEETLNALGFEYDRKEFDEFGNTFEVWTRDNAEESEHL